MGVIIKQKELANTGIKSEQRHLSNHVLSLVGRIAGNAVYAFGKGKDRERLEWKNKALELEKKLARKNSELMEKHVALKKSLGAS